MFVREVGLAMLGSAIWLAIALAAVSWPLSGPGRSPFRLGPISADVPAGQTFRATEPFDQISIPLRIGGPHGVTNQLNLRVEYVGQDGLWSDRSDTKRVKSTPERMEQITFSFEEPLENPGPLYFEIEVSPVAEWPTNTLATLADQAPDGRLYLASAPGFADQDLVFQLLRRQPLWERLAVWWSHYRAMAVTVAILLGRVHPAVFVIFGAMADAGIVRLRGVRPSVATLPAVASSVGAVFAIAFFR